MSQSDAHVFPTYNRAKLRFERGEGVRLFTEDGTSYLDLASGIAVNALGHAHPHLVEAVQRQSEKLWHTFRTSTRCRARKSSPIGCAR